MDIAKLCKRLTGYAKIQKDMLAQRYLCQYQELILYRNSYHTTKVPLQAQPEAKVDLFLIISPYFHSSIGAGHPKPIAIKPRREFPQP